jgi:hypothetical protein
MYIHRSESKIHIGLHITVTKYYTMVTRVSTSIETYDVATLKFLFIWMSENDNIVVQSARHNLETTAPYDYRPSLTQTVDSELVVLACVTRAILSALVTGN